MCGRKHGMVGENKKEKTVLSIKTVRLKMVVRKWREQGSENKQDKER